MVLASGLIAFMSMPLQEQALERADRRAIAGEGQAVADHHPEDRAERDRGQRLRHGGEHVLLAHHAGVEQRQARDAHHQHEAGRRDHPGGVGGVDLGRLCGGLRERRRRASAISIATQLSAPLRATPISVIVSPRISSLFLERVVVGFAGADAHGAIEVVDEDFAVADLAGLGGVPIAATTLSSMPSSTADLDLELGQEVHGVFGAAIDFGVALLAADSL